MPKLQMHFSSQSQKYYKSQSAQSNSQIQQLIALNPRNNKTMVSNIIRVVSGNGGGGGGGGGCRSCGGR
jgi:hypothetical protein